MPKISLLHKSIFEKINFVPEKQFEWIRQELYKKNVETFLLVISEQN